MRDRTLAVGLALRGFAVTATDASPGMVERAQALAVDRGVSLRAQVCPWEELGPPGWDDAFGAVLCVGNSLTHAAGRARRRAALSAMAWVLRPGGLLAVTSRNWERLLAARPGLEIDDRLTERHGRRGLVVRAWTLAGDWDAPHRLDVAVAFPDSAGAVTSHTEQLWFWPFTRDDLRDDLRAAGLAPADSSWAPDAERYLVTARRSAAGADAGPARPSP